MILEEQTINTSRIMHKVEDIVFFSNLIVFLNLTKEFDEIEKNKDSKFINSRSLASLYNDFRKIYGFCGDKIDTKLFCNFNNFGYVYHITKTEHVDSILRNGILTLNKWFNQDVYADCCELNRCWRNITRKNEQIKGKRLIEIPNKSRLYKKRFDSIYLTTDISEGLSWYGDGMELFSLFLDHLLFGIFGEISNKLKTSDQEIIKNKIIYQLKHKVDVEEKEITTILDFFDTYYEQMIPFESGYSSIIMVPKQNLISTNITCDDYQYLLKKSYHFYDYFINCNDIEYKGNISNEGLIAITLQKDETSKLKVKVKQNRDICDLQ